MTWGKSADPRSVNVLKHAALICAAVFLLHAWAPTAAEEKILVENLPAGIETSTALTFAREALQYREWTVVKQSADHVEAKISRNNLDAKIRIRQNGNQLVYEDHARGKAKVDYTGRLVPSTTETPSRWIYFLRSDITEKLQKYAADPAGITAAASPPLAAKETVAGHGTSHRSGNVQRMQELKEMLDRGLISADEYARKREQILNEL